jgi:hypothetical protein
MNPVGPMKGFLIKNIYSKKSGGYLLKDWLKGGLTG